MKPTQGTMSYFRPAMKGQWSTCSVKDFKRIYNLNKANWCLTGRNNFLYTVFPLIVSAEEVFSCNENLVSSPRCGHYSRVETIQGRKLFKGENYSQNSFLDLPANQTTYFSQT